MSLEAGVLVEFENPRPAVVSSDLFRPELRRLLSDLEGQQAESLGGCYFPDFFPFPFEGLEGLASFAGSAFSFGAAGRSVSSAAIVIGPSFPSVSSPESFWKR